MQCSVLSSGWICRAASQCMERQEKGSRKLGNGGRGEKEGKRIEERTPLGNKFLASMLSHWTLYIVCVMSTAVSFVFAASVITASALSRRHLCDDGIDTTLHVQSRTYRRDLFHCNSSRTMSG